MADDDKPSETAAPERKKPGRKPGQKGDQTTPEAIQTAELRGQVLSLRKQGWSYQAIGTALGFSAPRAYEILQSALAEIVREPTREVFDLEVQRLDTLLAAVFEAAENGDKQAIDTSLRIMERRARLLGLEKQPDAPVLPNNGQPFTVQIIAVPAKPNGHAPNGHDDESEGPAHDTANGHQTS